jgi:hypothetical protein
MDEAPIYRIEAGSEFVRQYSYRTEPGEPLRTEAPKDPGPLLLPTSGAIRSPESL